MKIGFGTTDWSSSIFENDEPVWGGAGWVRLGQYVKHFESEVVYGNLVSLKGFFGVRSWNGDIHTDCDVVVMQRVMHKDVAEKIKQARQLGQVIVNDLDDWYWGMATTNSAYLSSHPRYSPAENTTHYKKTLSRSSAITVSTQYLADRVKDWNTNVAVLPNTIDFDSFKKRVHEDPLTLGWAGSTSHRSGDLEILKGCLSDYSGRVVHLGDLEGAVSFSSVTGLETLRTHPMCPISEYSQSFDFDIGLAPLSDRTFNHAKSAIKVLEYTAANIPFVASGVGPYKGLMGAGKIVKSPGDWRKFVASLESVESREQEAQRNLEILSQFNIKDGAKRFEEFLVNCEA